MALSMRDVVKVPAASIWLALLGTPAYGNADMDHQNPFVDMARVLQHPRCMNCHTGEDFPRQSDDAHRHQMNVTRGSEDSGAAGLHCSACHQEQNQRSE